MFPTNLLEVIRMMMMMTTMMMMMIIIIITIITIVITITIYSSIKREKLLRHVAMVAKILNDNKPKTSLKKGIRTYRFFAVLVIVTVVLA